MAWPMVWLTRGRRVMSDSDSTEEVESVPAQHRRFIEEVNRAAVVAEARILVAELDHYLELIGAWALEASSE